MNKLLNRLVILAALLAVLGVTLPAAEADSLARISALQADLLKQLSSGVSNPDLYNQLGLSYYKQGEAGQAMLYFLRALRLNSNHREARNNHTYVLAKSADRELYGEPDFIGNLFRGILDFFSLNLLAVLTLIMLLLTTGCLHWLMHLPPDRERNVPVLWLLITGFLLLTFGVMLGLKYHLFQDSSKAVVMEKQLEGFGGPGSEFGKLFTVNEALVVHIDRTDKDWALITLPNGGAGWVQTSGLERVKP